MNEIHANELNEIRARQETGFLDIRPETDMDISAARAFWDGEFSGPENMIGGSVAEPEIPGVDQHDPDTKTDVRPRYYHTLNESLENDRHAITGVPFEKKIIELRYGLNGNKELTQREIAAMLKISRSYVSRIEKAALEKLRRRM